MTTFRSDHIEEQQTAREERALARHSADVSPLPPAAERMARARAADEAEARRINAICTGQDAEDAYLLRVWKFVQEHGKYAAENRYGVRNVERAYDRYV